MPLSAASARRSPVLPLFVGAGVAGFGLALFALSAALPRGTVAPLPPPGTTAPDLPAPSVTADTPTERPPSERVDWVPLFGTAAPEPEPIAPLPPPPAPEPRFTDDPYLDLESYKLRGLVVQDDGGWAMIETDEGLAIYRPGDFLPGGEELIVIEEDGIELDLDGERYFIGFDEVDETIDNGFDEGPAMEIEMSREPPALRGQQMPGRDGRGSAPAPNEFITGTIGR